MPTPQSSLQVNHTTLMLVEIGCPLTHAQLCGSLAITHIAVLDRTTLTLQRNGDCVMFFNYIYIITFIGSVFQVFMKIIFPINCYKLNWSHWSSPSRSVLSLFALVLQELECVLSWPSGRAYPLIQLAAAAQLTYGAQVDRFRCPSRLTLLIYH